MLGYILQIIGRLELGDLFPIGVNYADVAIIEVYLVIAIHQAHVVALHGVDVAGDQIQVVFVRQDNIVEQLQAEFAELDTGLGLFLEILSFSSVMALLMPPGTPQTG